MSDAETLLAALRASREELLSALEGVQDDQLDCRPPGPITDDEERWPIQQVLWHVGDTEDGFRRQVDQALSGREVLATPRRQPPEHLVTTALLTEWLTQSRRPTEVLLAKLSDADLDRELVRADGQTRTPRRLFTILESHDRAHADQIRALRALPAETA